MSERAWGDIEKEIRDDYLRADGPENINFREVQWDVWYAEVVREAGARALEEAADKFSAEDDPEWGFWQDYDDWSCDPSEPLRARAAEIREGK